MRLKTKISLLKERLNLRATALDISRKAIKIAKFNAKMHHLENKIKLKGVQIPTIEEIYIPILNMLENFGISFVEESV